MSEQLTAGQEFLEKAFIIGITTFAVLAGLYVLSLAGMSGNVNEPQTRSSLEIFQAAWETFKPLIIPVGGTTLTTTTLLAASMGERPPHLG